MADRLTSGEIRTRRFDVVRKGYDRVQVETFLAQVSGQVDDLESRLAEASESEASLGIDDAEAHARELATIGGEIAAILEVARSAAEAMRSRASTDAESWTSDADNHAYVVRESAWVEGSAMLAAATEEAQRVQSTSETDALRIRSEAEREAIRHTTDAKRASEETIGAAENEAEGILSSSLAESERVLRSANQSAALAQERARALEDRRAELMVELESTRSSIGDLDSEIESRKRVLEEPEPAVVPEYENRMHHGSDTGSVKIVSGSKVVPLRPVDADSFVAEVAEMHRTAESREPIPDASPQPDESQRLTVDSSQSEVELASDSSLPQLAGGDVEERVRGGRQPEESSQSEVELASDSSLPQLAGGDVEERVRGGRRQPIDSEPITEPEPAVDSIGSLFAQLREGSEQLTVDSSQPEEQPSAVSHQPSTEGESEEADIETTSLIPVQNAALRSIKRLLVDLQNDALEHLRTDKSWVPTEAFTDRFSEPFSELAIAITDDGADGGAASVFATDLYDAVSSVVIAAREAGSGDRAIAAATSKVFRTWRSDEAERRVVAVASDLSERV